MCVCVRACVCVFACACAYACACACVCLSSNQAHSKLKPQMKLQKSNTERHTTTASKIKMLLPINISLDKNIMKRSKLKTNEKKSNAYVL